MKYIFILLIFLSVGVSCHKVRPLQDIVFRGRYLGSGCWPVIQIMSPSITEFGLDPLKMKWIKNDTLYHDAIGSDISAEFRTGGIFYLTVNSIDSNVIMPANCIPTKYVLTVENIAFTKAELHKLNK